MYWRTPVLIEDSVISVVNDWTFTTPLGKSLEIEYV